MLFWLRDVAYRHGILPTVGAPLPVVGVGNLSFGGSGKTPVVQALAEYCYAKGRTPAIVLRGYRRRSRGILVVSYGHGPCVPWAQSGDEAWLHAWKLPQAIVVVDRRRERAIEAAHRLGAHIALADDCFQYRRLRKQVELLLLDRTTLHCPHVFPFGRLREPFRSVRRAHILLLNGVEPEELPAAARGLPWVRLLFRPVGLFLQSSTGQEPFELPAGEPLAAIAGIAHPERFRGMLQQLGLPLSLWKRFPDHYPYRLATVRRLLQDCLRQSIRWVVTTEKDFVRLRPFVAEFQRCGVGLLTLALRVEFAEGASLLWERLDALL